MADSIADAIINAFGDKLPGELIVFIISMLPVVELRGGIIAAKLLDISFVKAFIICFMGNFLPVPFILIFIKKIFDFLRDKKRFSGIIKKLEDKTYMRSEKALRWKGWGLLLFVAVPIPGTGGWTGSLIAALLEMKMKVSLPVIALGIFIADFIMCVLFYFILGSVI